MKDQISALMDDEMAPDSADHLFTAVKAGGEANECWVIYHLIGDVMRGNPVFKTDFKQRCMSKIEDEPFVLAPQVKKTYLKSSPMWQVAASVAAVTFVGWIVLQQGQDGEVAPLEIAQNLPSEYLMAHQASAPSNAAYYVQPAGYSESAR